MSRLSHTTICDGLPGQCITIVRAVNKATKRGGETLPPLTLQQLESRLYYIRADLQALPSHDLQTARALQEDAETTVAAVRALNRGDLTINVTHIMSRINDVLRNGFGKVGQFFINLSQPRTFTEAAEGQGADANDMEQEERKRLLSNFSFRRDRKNLVVGRSVEA